MEYKDFARVATAGTLASYRGPNDYESRLNAAGIVDKFWKEQSSGIWSKHAEQFIDGVVSDERFPRLHALGAGHNRLVIDGIYIIMRWLSDIATNNSLGNAITTHPTHLQLGTNGTTFHLPTYTGCVAPILDPPTTGLGEQVAAFSLITSPGSSYPKDTLQAFKQFTNGTGGAVTVQEMAIKNNDGASQVTRVCLARIAVTSTGVNPAGTVDCTYKFTIIP